MRLPAAPTGNKKQTGSENNVLGLVESKFLCDALMVRGINLCVRACVSILSHHGEDTGGGQRHSAAVVLSLSVH